MDDRGADPKTLGDALKPVDLGAQSRVLSLALSDEGTCVLLEGGSVKCWGTWVNRFLDLGSTPETMGDALLPLDFGGGRKVKQVAAGSSHWCFVLDDGSARCTGDNEAGQLGLGDRDTRGDDTQETEARLPPLDLGTKRHATAMFGGWAHTCALLDDTELKCWGLNDRGQLGLGVMGNRGGTRDEMGDALPPLSL
jgi:alpha-tubulin suppressor-like RCC1 family protein